MKLQFGSHNKKQISIIFSATCIIMLGACSQPSPKESEAENFQNELKSATKEQPAVSVPPSISEAEIEARFPSKPISKMINGVKMTAKVLPITRGSMVFDNSVKQNAMVKGDIVVVLNDNQGLPDELRQTYKIKELVEGVFSLEAEANEDMLEHYEKLSKNTAFSRVELGLFYGPEDGPETM